MTERSININNNYKIFVTTTGDQIFISTSVISYEGNPLNTIEDMYCKIGKILSEGKFEIIHERCFGNTNIREKFSDIRSYTFSKYNIDANTPFTFVEGKSVVDNQFSGLQIHAVKSFYASVKTIHENGTIKGRSWTLDGSTFYLLHGVGASTSFGINEELKRKHGTKEMFEQTEKLLKSEGASYKDVVRTWIYIADILDWYGDFNQVRNKCYSEYGFIGNDENEMEQIYLPASTGIEGKNSIGSPAIMDVLAVKRNPSSVVKVRPIYGTKQRSPFRYGSAFSRAIVIEEPNQKTIFISGTASIDEEGKSVFLNDTEAQIKHTFNVISALISPEGAQLKDICEATVFLKSKKDFGIFSKVVDELGLSQIPSVNVEADVCRDELLFELDAVFVI